MNEDTKSYQFKAEIKQLLNILIHSLYKEREIFLRELISNASDALTRLHFEMLTNESVLDPEVPLEIHIDVNRDTNTLIVKDSGIGMTHDELVRNLGTIAQSGAREFLQAISETEKGPSEIIGQFGVGFYSVFMVADRVKVISRSYQVDSDAGEWISSGGEDFSVMDSEKTSRGTEIHIALKEDTQEFLESWRLRQIISRHSDYIGYPIYVGEEQANQQESIWRRNPSKIDQEEYDKFYQQITMDFEEPISKIHLSSDAPLHLRALLYIPAKRERGLLNLRKDPGLSLYSNNVLIQEYNTDLLPKWLEFVVGIVDSEDLPLNVSRETVQSTRVMANLAKTLRSRIIREFKGLAEENSDKYSQFWQEFGSIFKEGLAVDPEAKEDILPLIRFYSVNSSDKLISLEEYVGNMAENQDEIYYIVGDDKKLILSSPHIEPFINQGLDVLLFVDPIDPFLSQYISEFDEHLLRNIDDASLSFPESEGDEVIEGEETTPDMEFNLLIGRFVTTLGDKVLEVRESKVLRNSPVRLVSPEDDPTRDLQRMQRYLTEEYKVPKKVLEINRRHPLIRDLAQLIQTQPEDELINITIDQLYESSLVIEGLHPNPVTMLPKVERLLELAANRSLKDDEL